MVSIDSVNSYGVITSVNAEETLRNMIFCGAQIPSPQEASLELYLATTALRSLDLRGVEFSYAQLEKVLKLCPFVQRIAVDSEYEAEAFARKILVHIGSWGNDVEYPSIFRAPLTFCHGTEETSLEKELPKLISKVNYYPTEELFRFLEFFLDPKHKAYFACVGVEVLEKFKGIEEEGQIKPRNLSPEVLGQVICYAAEHVPSYLAANMEYFIEKLHEKEEDGRSKLNNLETVGLETLSNVLFSEILVCEKLYRLVTETLQSKANFELRKAREQGYSHSGGGAGRQDYLPPPSYFGGFGRA